MTRLGKLLSLALLTSTLAGLTTACEKKDPCKDTADCVKLGKCTATPEGACKVGVDADCQISKACKVEGKCSVKDGACVAANDDGCRASENCVKNSICDSFNGMCVELGKIMDPACS